MGVCPFVLMPIPIVPPLLPDPAVLATVPNLARVWPPLNTQSMPYQWRNEVLRLRPDVMFYRPFDYE